MRNKTTETLPDEYLGLLGNNSFKTTEIYTHVSQKNFQNNTNPIDELL